MISNSKSITNPSLAFTGTHRMVGLLQATPRNTAINNILTVDTLSSTRDFFKSLLGNDSVSLSKTQNGGMLTLSHPSIGEFKMSAEGFAENGLLGGEFVVSGNPDLVRQVDDYLKEKLPVQVKQMNENVPDLQPGEQATYTYIA